MTLIHPPQLTSLHSAALWGNLEITKMLLKHGADPNKTQIVYDNYKKSLLGTDEPARTPEEMAREKGHFEVANFIASFNYDNYVIRKRLKRVGNYVPVITKNQRFKAKLKEVVFGDTPPRLSDICIKFGPDNNNQTITPIQNPILTITNLFPEYHAPTNTIMPTLNTPLKKRRCEVFPASNK